MATDFNKPVVTDAYATLLPGLVTANKDLAMMLEPTLTGTSTNLPTGAVRWNATTIQWERYNGTSWVTLPSAGDNVYAISISGNAATATALATARTIGGVSFNGTADINLPGVNTAGNQNTSGNAATATKLATARTIGGVSFDGTANISLPGVNTTGNQNTTGNAATATTALTSESANKLSTARTIGGVSFDGTANINLPGVNAAGNQNTTGNAATATTALNALGVGQTQVDVTGSRLLNTSYINSTGRTILVYGYITSTSGVSTYHGIGGSNVLGDTATSFGYILPFFLVVPNGLSYYVSTNTSFTLNKWFELR